MSVRVSVYLPWRPADVHCDGIEYSSYQYGLHQCWISHSGLAGCPPAAYSNIVSRIVIIRAELRPPRTLLKLEGKGKKYIFASIWATKDFSFVRGTAEGFGAEGAAGARGAPAST